MVKGITDSKWLADPESESMFLRILQNFTVLSDLEFLENKKRLYLILLSGSSTSCRHLFANNSSYRLSRTKSGSGDQSCLGRLSHKHCSEHRPTDQTTNTLIDINICSTACLLHTILVTTIIYLPVGDCQYVYPGSKGECTFLWIWLRGMVQTHQSERPIMGTMQSCALWVRADSEMKMFV